MGTRLVASVLVAILLTAAAYGQEGGAPGEGPDAQELTRLVLKLKRQVEENTKLIGTNSELIQSNAELTRQLRQELNDATTLINEQYAKQQQILDRQAEILGSIATEDSGGQNVLRLSAIMDKSPEFADDVGSAVYRSLRKTGDFVVVNKMSSDQTISINGAQHTVLAGASLSLEVPTGTVAAQLPGQDPTFWVVRPPDYSFTLNINPRQTVLRPVVSEPATTVVQRSASTSSGELVYRVPATDYAAPVTSYYAPTTSYYAPTTTYYAPTAANYAPTTTYYGGGSYYGRGYYRRGLFGTGLFGWGGLRGINRRYDRRNPVTVQPY